MIWNLLLLASPVTSVFWNETFQQGVMSGLYTAKEIETELAYMTQYYSEYVTREVLGLSFRNDTIHSLRLTAPNSGVQKTNVLLTAGHSASKPVGSSFLLYVMKQMMLQREQPIVKYILHALDLHFVPVINVDALTNQAKHYNSSSSFASFETNANVGNCTTPAVGVNLNRNYGFMWGFDDEGSSAAPCQDLYRGAAPFSEVETKAMRKYVLDNNIRFALDYEDTGNYYLTPLLYTTSDNYSAFHAIADLPAMQSISKELNFPSGAKVGGMDTIMGTAANGAFIDWLYSINIPAYQIALGLNSTSDIIGPSLVPTYDTHLPAFLSLMQRAVPYPQISSAKVHEEACDEVKCMSSNESYSRVVLSVTVQNVGLRNLSGVDVRTLIEIPDSNYSFLLQPVQQSFSYLDLKGGSPTTNISGSDQMKSGKVFDAYLEDLTLMNRSETQYDFAIERAKLPNTTFFPPITINFTVTALSLDASIVQDWMEESALRFVTFELMETITTDDNETLARKDDGDDDEDHKPMIVGLSIAGSFVLLLGVAVAAYYIVRRWQPKQPAMNQLPQQDFSKGVEPSGITLQMDMTRNQV